MNVHPLDVHLDPSPMKLVRMGWLENHGFKPSLDDNLEDR